MSKGTKAIPFIRESVLFSILEFKIVIDILYVKHFIRLEVIDKFP